MKISSPLNLGLPGNQHSEAEKKKMPIVLKKTSQKTSPSWTQSSEEYVQRNTIFKLFYYYYYYIFAGL